MEKERTHKDRSEESDGARTDGQALQRGIAADLNDTSVRVS